MNYSPPVPQHSLLGSCFSSGESRCSRARGSVNEVPCSAPRWEAFGKGKLRWVLTKRWHACRHACAEAAEGVSWGVRSGVYHESTLPQPLFLLKPADSQTCPDFFSRKARFVGRSYVQTCTYLFSFYFH